MTINKLSDQRKKILENMRIFSKNLDDSLSVLLYPCTWYKNLGYYKVQSFYKINKLSFYYQYLKELFLISSLSSYKIYKSKKFNFKNKKNLYISWCTKKDFDKNFLYKDKYIPKKVRKNDIWFLINVGEKIDTSKNKSKNILVFQKTKYKNFNIFYLFEIFLKFILDRKNQILSLGIYRVFSDIVNKEIFEIIEKGTFKRVIMPYEAQPFQKKIILNLKKKYRKIKIISYLNAIQPFPIHLYNKDIIPDHSYSVSRSQIYQMTQIFNWDKNKISLIKSHKFIKDNLDKYNNKIVLPHYINNKKKILDTLNQIIKSRPKNFFTKLEIAPHPVGKNNNKYKNFVNILENKLSILSNKFTLKKKKQCFVIGSTSSVFEALELGIEVYHIVEDAYLEAVENYFWPSVKVKKLNDNLFVYKKVSSKVLINY